MAGELVTPGELLEAAGPAARERPLSWNKRKYQSYVFIIILLFGLNIVKTLDTSKTLLALNHSLLINFYPIKATQTAPYGFVSDSLECLSCNKQFYLNYTG